jgi:hypothetical protein
MEIAPHINVDPKICSGPVINQYLQTTKTTDETDPILSLIGTLHLGTTDLGENHDQYIGEALYQELRNAK